MSELDVFLDLQPPPIEPLDNQLSLADLEVIKVIGKGNSGNVQLVKHKLTQQFFALKVDSEFCLCPYVMYVASFSSVCFSWLNTMYFRSFN